MKTVITFVFVFSLLFSARSQSALTLGECYERAEAHYPLIKQTHLIERTKNLSVENALKGHLPRIQVNGQATYQSDVIQIPVELPGVEPLSKDQYRIFGEVSQTLYQGGLVHQQKDAAQASSVIEQKQLEVDLYELRSRINDLFFGILLLREQITQSELIRDAIGTSLKKTRAAIAYGTALPGAADVLQAEVLKVEQRIIEMSASEDVYRKILSKFVGESISRETVLQRPVLAASSSSISRPELELFKARSRSLEIQRAQLSSRSKPRVELFFQAGYGRPGLNMLENRFDTYYLGGLRFAWQISGYYTLKRDYEILDLRRQSVDLQKETFLFNTGLSLDQFESEMTRLRRLVEVDDEIIALRAKVRRTAEVQLEEGVITSSEYIREVNAEDQAKQSRALHDTQLLLAQARYLFISGQSLNP